LEELLTEQAPLMRLAELAIEVIAALPTSICHRLADEALSSHGGMRERNALSIQLLHGFYNKIFSHIRAYIFNINGWFLLYSSSYSSVASP